MINELFEGNIQYYNRALDELNSFESYNGAKTYLIELSVQHRWENHGWLVNVFTTSSNDVLEKRLNKTLH